MEGGGRVGWNEGGRVRWREEEGRDGIKVGGGGEEME